MIIMILRWFYDSYSSSLLLWRVVFLHLGREQRRTRNFSFWWQSARNHRKEKEERWFSSNAKLHRERHIWVLKQLIVFFACSDWLLYLRISSISSHSKYLSFLIGWNTPVNSSYQLLLTKYWRLFVDIIQIESLRGLLTEMWTVEASQALNRTS